MQIHEAHAERLVGQKVRDVNGEVVGRIEELIVELIDGEAVVTEYHLGPEAVLERIGAFLDDMPYFRLLPFARRAYRVAWSEMDLTEPWKPRVRVARRELQRIEP